MSKKLSPAQRAVLERGQLIRNIRGTQGMLKVILARLPYAVRKRYADQFAHFDTTLGQLDKEV